MTKVTPPESRLLSHQNSESKKSTFHPYCCPWGTTTDTLRHYYWIRNHSRDTRSVTRLTKRLCLSRIVYQDLWRFVICLHSMSLRTWNVHEQYNTSSFVLYSHFLMVWRDHTSLGTRSRHVPTTYPSSGRSDGPLGPSERQMALGPIGGLTGEYSDRWLHIVWQTLSGTRIIHNHRDSFSTEKDMF